MNRRTNRRSKSKHKKYKSRRSKYLSRRSRKKPSKIKRLNWFTRKHPITTGIILILASIILFRLSFINAFLNSGEIFGWSILISILLFIAGLLVLIGWWRNNISILTTRHTVRWR